MFWTFYGLSKYVYYLFNKGPLQASKISGKGCDVKIIKNLPVLFELIYHERNAVYYIPISLPEFSYVITLNMYKASKGGKGAD